MGGFGIDWYIRDELPKHIKEIGEVNKISRKVSGRQFVASSGQSPESPSQPRTAPAETQTELGRLDVIRKTLSNKGFSKQAIDIICASLGQQALRNSTRECGTSGLAGVINAN